MCGNTNYAKTITNAFKAIMGLEDRQIDNEHANPARHNQPARA